MGKIFGISDLPVSTITSVFEEIKVPKPKATREYKTTPIANDTFVYKKRKAVSNPFIKMKNGFGKLMKHFSKKI